MNKKLTLNITIPWSILFTHSGRAPFNKCLSSGFCWFIISFSSVKWMSYNLKVTVGLDDASLLTGLGCLGGGPDDSKSLNRGQHCRFNNFKTRSLHTNITKMDTPCNAFPRSVTNHTFSVCGFDRREDIISAVQLSPITMNNSKHKIILQHFLKLNIEFADKSELSFELNSRYKYMLLVHDFVQCDYVLFHN